MVTRKYLLVFLILASFTNLYGQYVIDNFFAFGFDNVYKWHSAVINQKVENNVARVIFFEEMNTVRTRSIICMIHKLEDQSFQEFTNDNSDNKVKVNELENPYSDEMTYIYKPENDDTMQFAFIDHFGHVIIVMYTDKENLMEEDFQRFVKSYSNVKLNF